LAVQPTTPRLPSLFPETILGEVVGVTSQLHQQSCFWVIVGEIACLQHLIRFGI
jgi:hypothetical protein